MGVSKGLGEVFKEAGTILKSNEAINKMDDFFLGGFRNVHANMGKEKNFVDAVKKAYTKNGDGTGGLAYGKIAGSYLTASAGYRVLSGGGAYRDSDGNTNLIGVPFV